MRPGTIVSMMAMYVWQRDVSEVSEPACTVKPGELGLVITHTHYGVQILTASGVAGWVSPTSVYEIG